MIYLFNQTEELIDVIDEASLADFTHTIELNQFDRFYSYLNLENTKTSN